MPEDPVRAQLEAAVRVVRDVLTTDVVGAWLYGSAVAGGLRPDSDLDLFVVTARAPTADEKRRLIDGLRPISRRGERPANWRPMELTMVALPDVRPWRHPARQQLQYGEWFSDDELAAQATGPPVDNPDLGVPLAMVRAEGEPLIGPPADQILDPVPRADLERAMVDSLPALLGDLEDDTRNVLLTLARMWCTVVTGEIRSKDAAADWAIERLPDVQRPLLATARHLYREGGWGSWADLMPRVRQLAELLAERVRAEAGRAG